MAATAKVHRSPLNHRRRSLDDVGNAYSEAGQNYLTYADGDATQLFSFSSQYAYSDRYIWTLLERKLVERRATGAKAINIFDAGCGPGTWLRRIVTRARELGFATIRARGVDMARAQIDQARHLARDLADAPGIDLRFEVGDLSQPIGEPDASVDLALCLYCVLNHIPMRVQPGFLAEMARLTAGQFITTVRAAGSVPTIYVDAIENARSFRQDHERDRCDIELANGRHITLNSHLFTARELRAAADRHFDVEDLRGLDLFHSRFAPDPRWNPEVPTVGAGCRGALERLEQALAADPRFIDHATHLLLVGRRRSSVWSSWLDRAIRVRRAASSEVQERRGGRASVKASGRMPRSRSRQVTGAATGRPGRARGE